MLEALEDMLEQQRKAISAQKVAISALKDPDVPADDVSGFKSTRKKQYKHTCTHT